MYFEYLIVPMSILAGFVALFCCLLKYRRILTKTKKIMACFALLGFLFIGGFFSWRFTEIAIYPHIYINSLSFGWKGSQYTSSHSFFPDDMPPSKQLKPAAYIKNPNFTGAETLLQFVFFPDRLYEVKNQPDVLWEIGLMDEMKYDRVR